MVVEFQGKEIKKFFMNKYAKKFRKNTILKSKVKVSIVTVCYNSSVFIRSAIESVLLQDYPNVEYIIVDGSSNDNTMSIISEYNNRINKIISEPDRGIYDAMNKGISFATGEVIGILNSDDFYPHSEVLTHVVDQFKQHPETDLVLGNVDFVSSEDLTKPVRLYSSFDFSPWKLRFGFMPAHPGAFIKKSAYELVGMYKLGYKSGADFDIFVRMLLVSKLHYVKLNEVLVRMQIGGISTSGAKSYVRTTREILRSLKENKIYSNLLIVLCRLPVKFFQIFLKKFKSK